MINNQQNKQQTIKKEVSIKGVGLHTGVKTVATFKPAEENFGIRFKRLDLKNCPEIMADIDHVIDISRGTTIGQNDFRIHTVEHILSAVFGLQIDNILIELTEKEPPVMDGSARPFVDVLLKSGIQPQKAMRDELIIGLDELNSADKKPSSFYRPQFEENVFDPFTEVIDDHYEAGRHERPSDDDMKKKWVDEGFCEPKPWIEVSWLCLILILHVNSM